MIVTFTGTGEACDPQRRNSSILLETAGCRYLLDCGFSSGAVSFSGADQAPLTSVWFSHFHGDHFFGIPQLLLMLYTQKRAAPLTILSGTDCREILYHTINLAYPGLTEKLPFPLMFIQLSPGRPKAHQGLLWQAVPVAHTAEAFALRVSDRYHSLYYSGDGKPTTESMDLMRGCTLVIHEAFSYKPTDPGHGSIDECLQLAAQLALPRLALIHINRETRAMLDRGEKNIQTPPGTELFIPEDGETVILQAP
ncbi:MAG: ribonuclease Z [Desulfopila sp.]|jgi:ribonuclease BN (tRNA processing enzyme)|nr:ribonuclease Z [Desulfopila sp.]